MKRYCYLPPDCGVDFVLLLLLFESFFEEYVSVIFHRVRCFANSNVYGFSNSRMTRTMSGEMFRK